MDLADPSAEHFPAGSLPAADASCQLPGRLPDPLRRALLLALDLFEAPGATRGSARMLETTRWVLQVLGRGACRAAEAGQHAQEASWLVLHLGGGVSAVKQLEHALACGDVLGALWHTDVLSLHLAMLASLKVSPRSGEVAQLCGLLGQQLVLSGCDLLLQRLQLCGEGMERLPALAARDLREQLQGG